MSNWISVEKQEPPKNGTRFAVHDSHGEFIPFVFWDEDDNEWLSESYAWSGRFYYWMPITSPEAE